MQLLEIVMFLPLAIWWFNAVLYGFIVFGRLLPKIKKMLSYYWFIKEKKNQWQDQYSRQITIEHQKTITNNGKEKEQRKVSCEKYLIA